jgi:hypothetical protein
MNKPKNILGVRMAEVEPAAKQKKLPESSF